jgi:pectin methylesterase-like acyl-CoA thioesterase
VRPHGAIQQQIDAAADGGTVVVPAGAYQESLTINKNLTLSGVDRTTTILLAPDSPAGPSSRTTTSTPATARTWTTRREAR